MRLRSFALAAAAALSAAAASAAEGNAARGEHLYDRCAACHALTQDRVGPRHCGLLGRRAGSVTGFDYSAAMRKSGIVWTARALDRFLSAPTKDIPGTTMTYDGVADAQERADLIAYLAAADRSAACQR